MSNIKNKEKALSSKKSGGNGRVKPYSKAWYKLFVQDQVRKQYQ
ncbi:hypothetical protein [Elizabethkingia anophelis]